MLADDQDTIAAVATAPGRGGIGIVRVSGPEARRIARETLGTDLAPRHATLCQLTDAAGAPLDQAIALFFPGPASFTGEDVLELQCHGGPVVLEIVLEQVCSKGARPAAPGEFTQRAFINDKLDLAQAEAVADLINSSTRRAALNAGRSLQGEFSRRVQALADAVLQLRVYVEAAMDFPEEEIDFLAEGAVEEKMAHLQTQLEAVLASAEQGRLLRDGMKVVIAGRPNAGKSSLLNQLSGTESAIVTDLPGTTRDVLREHIQIDGMPLHVIDTAGLRESDDPIEQEGVRRALEEIREADRILLVVDDQTVEDPIQLERLWPEFLPGREQAPPCTIVRNKCDLSGASAGYAEQDGVPCITLSVKTGAGLRCLKKHLKRSMGFEEGEETGFSARRRHLVALEQAGAALNRGIEQLRGAGAGELLAEDLRDCHAALGTITGAVSSDDLLGEIFSSFCIGK